MATSGVTTELLKNNGSIEKRAKDILGCYHTVKKPETSRWLFAFAAVNFLLGRRAVQVCR
jgi:hypothetical protein